MGNRLDFLSSVESARIVDDIADLFNDSQITVPITWYYLTHSVSAPTSWAFSGNATGTSATDNADAIRGHIRDSSTNEIEVGRYRWLIKAASLTTGTPSTNDVIQTIVNLNTTDYRVNAVRLDTLSNVYVVEATRVVEGGG